jgi:hypothetical protein
MAGAEVAEAVGSEQHGRLGMSAILHGLDPVVDWVAKIGLTLSAIAIVVVLVDIVMRGRLRKTAFAFASLQTSLSLLMGLYAAAGSTINAWLELPSDTAQMGSFVAAQAAVALVQASLFAGLGIILTFILRLDDAWRGRKGAHPRAPTP